MTQQDSGSDWYSRMLDLKAREQSLIRAKDEARRLGQDGKWRRLNKEHGALSREMDRLRKICH